MSEVIVAPSEEPSAELLEDLCFKFILTAPKDTLRENARLFFLVEQCWWYYEDKVREVQPHLKHYASYATFAEALFRKCEALSPMRAKLQELLEEYRRYKQGIPVCGAILLDASMEQVLLVRGNKSSMGWGFPRGKINEGEAESVCAIREVLEETGYDISAKLRDSDYLEITSDGKRHKLYIVTGLDPKTQEFEPHCKWEIGAYAWHRVDALPATSEEASQVYMSADGVRHRFFMIHPFVGRLRRWIDKRRRHMAGWQAAGGPAGASSAPPSLQMPMREALALAMGPPPGLSISSNAGASISGSLAASISGPQQPRREGKGADRPQGASPPRMQHGSQHHQPEQLLLRHKLVQLNAQQQAQAHVTEASESAAASLSQAGQGAAGTAALQKSVSAGVSAGASAGMPRFSFDQEAIMRCFSTVAS